MSETKTFLAHTAKSWRAWLEKNHEKENTIILVKYKKHTKKPTFTHQEAMDEAICFGWIDTTAKRIDDETWGVTFRKRTKNARWSNNTLSYAKHLINEGKMTPTGLKAYHLGLQKTTIDIILPDNHMPLELTKEFKKNPTLKKNFDSLAQSYKKIYVHWIERAKLPETRKKRVQTVLKNLAKGKTKWDGKY